MRGGFDPPFFFTPLRRAFLIGDQKGFPGLALLLNQRGGRVDQSPKDVSRFYLTPAGSPAQIRTVRYRGKMRPPRAAIPPAHMTCAALQTYVCFFGIRPNSGRCVVVDGRIVFRYSS